MKASKKLVSHGLEAFITTIIVLELLLLETDLAICRSVGGFDNSTALGDCIKAPESILINCKIVNSSSSAECIKSHVVSVPWLKMNNNVLINCTAPYPIDVKINGFQVTDTTYKIYFVRNADNVFNEATFVYSIGIIADFRDPRKISVFSFSDPSQKIEFFMFRPSSDEKQFEYNNETFDTVSESVKIEINQDKTTVPCISSDPHVIPELIRLHGTNQSITVNQDSVKYDITEGFIINAKQISNLEGNYYCTNRQKTVFELVPKEESEFEPNMNHIILFKNQDLIIKCRNNKNIQLVGKFKDANIEAKTTIDNNDYTSTFVHKKVNVGDEGKIDCIAEDGITKLHSWTIETLDIYNNPKLELKKLDQNEVACISNFPNVKMQTVFCQGVSNCELNQDCFKRKSNCPSFQEGYPCKNVQGSCFNFTQNANHSQGMIKCTAGNYSYITNYFRGFDNILYLNWKQAPLDALIEVKVPTNITMYPHNSYPFGCRASRFISDGKIQWVIRGKDGSEILLHKQRVQDISPTYNLDYDLYTVRESNIRLIYPNDYDVICMVPMWNATASVRNDKRINVADKKAPVMEIVIIAVVAIILLIIPLVYVMWRLKKAKDAIRNLTEQEVESFIKGNPEALKQASKDKDAHEVVDNIPYDKDLFEIPRDKLLIDTENILGEGAFGQVLKAKVDGITEMVAVKTVKQRCEVDQFKGFLSELKIMMYIGKHPFVVTLIGAYTEKIREKVIYIVVEFCAHGSLENFLRKRKELFLNQIRDDEICSDIIEPSTYENVREPNGKSVGYVNWSGIRTIDLVRWAYQVATGMDYLASKKVVHADLAARNVLIHESGIAKITDFGLSRQLFDYKPYVKKQEEPLPWRWMSIESLQSLSFSTQSDVWAYGVLLWELYSLGDVPYPGLTWTINFVDDLVNGLRMTKPTYATSAIYNIILNCWQMEPKKRPTFKFLSEYFRDLLVELKVDVTEASVPTDVLTTLSTTNLSTTNWKRASENFYLNSTTLNPT